MNIIFCINPRLKSHFILDDVFTCDFIEMFKECIMSGEADSHKVPGTPSVEGKTVKATLGRLLRPWKWNRRKKAEKLEKRTVCKFNSSTTNLFSYLF